MTRPEGDVAVILDRVNRFGGATMVVTAPWVAWEAVSRLWPESLYMPAILVSLWAIMSMIRGVHFAIFGLSD